MGIGCVFHVSIIDFLARNCLSAPCELDHCHGGESNRLVKVQAFFLRTASRNRFSIST
jgi:hypothetical protein